MYLKMSCTACYFSLPINFGAPKKKLLWNFICILSLAIIQILLLGYSIKFDFSYIINGGDTLQLLNPQLFIQKSFYLWFEEGTGLPLPIPGYWIFYAVPLHFLNLLFGNINVATFVMHAILLSLAPIAMFLLINNVTNSIGIAFFTGLFYSLNLYTAINFHTPVAHSIYFFSVTPLLILVFMKMESAESHRKKAIYIALYILFYLPLIRTLNVFIIYLIIVPVTAFILNFGIKIPIKKFMKYLTFSLVTTLMFAFPFLVPQIFQTAPITTPVTIMYTKSSANLEIQQRLMDSIRFVRTFALQCPHEEVVGGILSYGFLDEYTQNFFLAFITYYPIIVVSFLLLCYYHKLQTNEKHRIIVLSLLAAMSLFAATPSLIPIGNIFYKSNVFAFIFRSAWKYFSPPYILFLSLILAILLKKVRFEFQARKFLCLLLVLILIHSVYIMPAMIIYSKMVNQAWIVQTPPEYYIVAEFLNSQKEEFRVLPLPITRHIVGYTPYKWGYVGPDILTTLTDKPLLDKTSNTIAPIEYLELAKKLEGATYEELIQLCKVLNVKYILLRNDADTKHPYIKLNNPPEYYKDVLENSDAIKNKYTIGNLVIYELKEVTPRIFMVPAALGRNISEMFFYSTHKPENVTYLRFTETSAPITLNVYGSDPVTSFSLNISFAFKSKNVTEDYWEKINYVPIQTTLFKVAFSPKGVLYVFAYSKEGDLWSLVRSFTFKTETNYTLRLEFKDGKISVFFNSYKLGEDYVNPRSLPIKITIGSNFGGTEKFVGEIYCLDFSVNNKSVLDTQKLFQDYPEYVETRTIYKLFLSLERIEWIKISPTKYIVKLNVPPTRNGSFLVFLNTYDPNWEAYYINNGFLEKIPQEKHIRVFDYANAWYIDRSGDCIIILEYTPQRIYEAGLKIDVLIFLVLLTVAILPKRMRVKLKMVF